MLYKRFFITLIKRYLVINNVNGLDDYLRSEMMTSIKYKDLLTGVMAISAVVAVMSYTIDTDKAADEVVAIHFSDLSNAEIDRIVAVKTEMYTANDLEN